MRKIGYARVSSASQNLDRQVAALRAERVELRMQLLVAHLGRFVVVVRTVGVVVQVVVLRLVD